ncbi:hypothetical protein BGX33_002726 [Mortierella sp. NVP41]|nr:hypothetical protein BGX33_002726 [Mortierella sp. NVP41]
MNPSIQAPAPVHQAIPLADSDIYPPAYPSPGGGTPADGSFYSYNEAISFVELYSPKTTMTQPDQPPRKHTFLEDETCHGTDADTRNDNDSDIDDIRNCPLAQTTLSSGGPVVMIFGFFFVCMMTATIALSLTDISSGFPGVKGGLIEYSRRLAPPRLRRISSWTVGWLHFSAFIATGQVPQWWITVLIHIIISLLFGATNAYNVNIDMISGKLMS